MARLADIRRAAFRFERRRFENSGTVFQIGLVPSRVDVINQIDGVEFEDAWGEHKIVQIENLQIPIIGKTQLLINKQSTGRPKDRNDALWLQDE